MAWRIGQPGAGASPQCPPCEPGDKPLHLTEVPRAQGFPAMFPGRSWTPLPHSRLLTSGVSPHLWVGEEEWETNQSKGHNGFRVGRTWRLRKNLSLRCQEASLALDFVWL